MATKSAQVNTNGLTFEQVLALAKKGDIECRYQAGLMYHYGEGVEKDAEKAFNFCLSPAEQGHRGAQAYVGYCYHSGKLFVRKNYRKALHWYTLSAGQGYAPAQYTLGNIHLLGLGTHRSYRKSVQWFSKAADQGHLEAVFQLARAYKLGKGVVQSNTKSMSLLQVAAEGNIVAAKYLLGIESITGKYIEADIDEGIRLLEAAAHQGHEAAEETLVALEEFKTLDSNTALAYGLPQDNQLPLRLKTLIRMEQIRRPPFAEMAEDVRDFVALNPEAGFLFLEDLAGLALRAASEAQEDGEIIIADRYETMAKHIFA